MVSNCAWARPILSSSGRVLSLCRKVSSSASAWGTASGGGGTNSASRIVDPRPPIQFCVLRSSPGARCEPRPSASSLSWISRISRTETGSSSRRARP